MRIISQLAPAAAPSDAAAMQALKNELEQLKAEVSALRAVKTPSPLVGEGGDEGPSRNNVVPSPKPSPTGGEGLTPVVSGRAPDPLFAQLWTYINTEK